MPRLVRPWRAASVTPRASGPATRCSASPAARAKSWCCGCAAFQRRAPTAWMCRTRSSSGPARGSPNSAWVRPRRCIANRHRSRKPVAQRAPPARRCAASWAISVARRGSTTGCCASTRRTTSRRGKHCCSGRSGCCGPVARSPSPTCCSTSADPAGRGGWRSPAGWRACRSTNCETPTPRSSASSAPAFARRASSASTTRCSAVLRASWPATRRRLGGGASTRRGGGRP